MKSWKSIIITMLLLTLSAIMVSAQESTIALPETNSTDAPAAGYYISMGGGDTLTAMNRALTFFTNLHRDSMDINKFRFIDIATGERVSIKADVYDIYCGGLISGPRECSYTLPWDQMTKLKDDHQYRVKLIVKEKMVDAWANLYYNTYKSDTAKLNVNLIDAAELYAPTHNGIVTQYFSEFAWTHSPLTIQYTLKVKDITTGEIVMNKPMIWNTVCILGWYPGCGTTRGELKNGHVYKWWIVSENDIAKTSSVKHKFTYKVQ